MKGSCRSPKTKVHKSVNFVHDLATLSCAKSDGVQRSVLELHDLTRAKHNTVAATNHCLNLVYMSGKI